MTLSDIASIGNLVGSLAVAVSLIYLGLQTHQAAKHTQALISQGRSARLSDFLATFSETDRLSAVLEMTIGAPPPPELIKRAQARMYFQGCFAGWIDVFEQHQKGLLSDDHLADVRASVFPNMGTLPARRFWEQWKAARPNTHAAFKAWVDDAIATMPLPDERESDSG